MIPQRSNIRPRVKSNIASHDGSIAIATSCMLKLLLSISLLSFSMVSLSASVLDYRQSYDDGYQEELVSDDDFYIDEYSENRVFFALEASLGGNTLETITFDNGETDSIRAGSGIYFSLGAAHLIFNKNMDVGFKGGILVDQITVENNIGDKSTLSFTRYPIDLFSHVWLGRHVMGGGLSYHIDPIFRSDATDQKSRYKDALGAYVEYLDHFVDTGTALGIKYMSIRYTNEETKREADGSAVGITFSQLF